MNKSHHLGELQYAIMRVLWEREEASVAQVWEELPEPHQRALTTIATMLSKMEKKGVVHHRAEGRQFIYRPAVSEPEVASEADFLRFLRFLPFWRPFSLSPDIPQSLSG